MARVREDEGARRQAADHRMVNAMVDRVREFLQAPRPDVGAPGSHRWGERMSSELLALYHGLARHFDEEEHHGLFEELAERFPRAARRIDQLRGEHDVLLDKLRTAIHDTLVYTGGRRPANPRLRASTLAVLNQLLRHEERETELRQRLYTEEIGTGG
jgi:hypothetical protein